MLDRSKMSDAISSAADKAGLVVTAALALSGAALLIAAAALVIAVRKA